MVEVEVQLLFRVGGWSDKTKLILISTLVEVVVEVEVELGNYFYTRLKYSANQMVGWGLRIVRGISSYLLLMIFKPLVQPYYD